jgi:type II secretory pathway pseudopilin PulG
MNLIVFVVVVPIWAAVLSLLGALCFWGGAKIARTPPVTYGRCWRACFTAGVVSGFVSGIGSAILGTEWPVHLALLAICFLIHIVCILSILDGWNPRGLAAYGVGMVVYLSVIGLLMLGVVLGASNARETARKLVSQNNLTMIGMALRNREGSFRCFPPAVSCGKSDNKPLLSWRVAILPYLDEMPLYEKFHFDEPWDSPNNKPLLSQMPRIFRSPHQRDDQESYVTYYQVFVQTGEDSGKSASGRAPFSSTPAREGPRLSDFTKDPSKTILVVEGGEPVPWTKPDDLPYSATGPLPKLGGDFPSGTNALFADGSTHWLPRNIGEKRLRALITCDGGEPIDLRDLDAP